MKSLRHGWMGLGAAIIAVTLASGIDRMAWAEEPSSPKPDPAGQLVHTQARRRDCSDVRVAAGTEVRQV